LPSVKLGGNPAVVTVGRWPWVELDASRELSLGIEARKSGGGKLRHLEEAGTNLDASAERGGKA